MARTNQATAEGISLLSPYWSTIVGARAQGLSRSDTWGLLEEGFQAGGASFRGATIFDMNAMWQRAGQVLSAEAAFGSSPRENPVTGDMWAWAPWAGPSTAAWQSPQYMINYATAATDAEGNVLLDDEGNPIPVWGATDWSGSLDVTTGAVIDRVIGSAQAALDTGSPGIRNQFAAIRATSLGDVLSVQILRF